MWSVTAIETRAIELDFRSSGQGVRADASLVAGSTRLVNAAGLIEYDPTSDRVQVQVCEECGFTHCAPGGWVSLRRLGDNVAFLPAFAAMSKDARSSEYSPPRYIQDRGAPLLSASIYVDLCSHVRRLPALTDIRPLSLHEAALVLQWEAPGRILGTYPEVPAIRQEFIASVDYGDREQLIAVLARLLAESWRDGTHAVQRSEVQPRSFFLDLPGHPLWSPFAEDGDEWVLSLGPDVHVGRPRTST